ncbi:unnamed protein product, partial [Rotaria sordida]
MGFHNLTGNFWKYRDQFIKIPRHYYLFSNDLDSLVRKEVYMIFILFSAKILQRGLAKENIDEHTELKDTDTDLALLMLDNKTPNMTKDQYFNPKFDFVSSKPGDIPINSNLYLVGYNGELLEQKDLAIYRYLEDFNNTTIYQLNRCHHVNYKCNKYVSINSHQFQTFIGETILPNIKNDK